MIQLVLWQSWCRDDYILNSGFSNYLFQIVKPSKDRICLGIVGRWFKILKESGYPIVNEYVVFSFINRCIGWLSGTYYQNRNLKSWHFTDA